MAEGLCSLINSFVCDEVFAPVNNVEKDVSHRYSSHDNGVRYVKISTHNYPQVQ